MKYRVQDYGIYCYRMRLLRQQAIAGNMQQRRDALRIMEAMAEQNPTFAARWTAEHAIQERKA